jgi:hypothetical protein
MTKVGKKYKINGIYVKKFISAGGAVVKLRGIHIFAMLSAV